MARTPSNDDLASICSSLSSDDGVRGGGGAGRTNEHLIDLLTRPRSRGGYGGRVNYGEFSSLARSLGWSSEDMDDCWYDIMMGEASAEAVDMARVAECICSYCLASPLPLLENYKLHKSSAAGTSSTSRSSSTSLSSSTSTSSHAAFSPAEVHEGISASKREDINTPPRRAPALAAPGRSSSQGVNGDMQDKTFNNTTVVLSPPSPAPPAAAPLPSPPTSPASLKAKVNALKVKHNAQVSPARRAAGRFPRYAVETASSESKKLKAASPTRASSSRRRPSSSTAAGAAGASARPGSTVFFRLYENGVAQQRQRDEAKAAAAAQEAAATAASCPFKPSIVPYTAKKKAKKGETAADDVDSIGVQAVQYNKPTQSYFAKLTEAERSNDAIAKAPATPRVSYHPAPGPSTSVPAGYVDGVARLRRYVAARYENAELRSGLRDPVRHDVGRLVDAPILRLPVTVEGVADTVDVRLASAQRRSPSRSQAPQQPQQQLQSTPYSHPALHHPSHQPQQKLYPAHAESGGPPATASTPRRSPSGLVRYKEHPVYY